MQKKLTFIGGLLIIGIFALFTYGPNKPQAESLPAAIENPLVNEKPALTPAEVSAHNNATSCYTVVSGKVYDLTGWISKHPGGERAITSLCGQDGTSLFNNKHGLNETAKQTLASFYIADLAT